jgi:plastocyanin
VFRPHLIQEGGAGTGVVPDVVMQHYVLIPSTLRVPLGTVVTWLNDDEFDHRLGATGEGGFEAPSISEGRSFQTRFNRVGTFEVACRIHPGMRSTVIVEP